MTVINHKSISGITSITAPAGSDDLLTVHTNDTTERFRIVDSGAIVTGVATASNFKTGTTNVHNVGVELAGINVLGADTPIGTGATIYDAGGAVFTGLVTATSFSGTGNVSAAGLNVTGITTFLGAINVADVIRHGGDTNTQIRFPANDTFTVETNGTERLRIQSDGQKIVKNGRLNILSTFIDFSGNISTPQTGAAIFRPAADTLAVSINNNERLRMRSSGQLEFKNGSFSDNVNCVMASGSTLTIGATASIKFRTATNQVLLIDSNGLISNRNRSSSDYGSPQLLIGGGSSTLTMMGDGSTNNSSYTGIKFRVAGTSTGDYTKAALFAQRQGGYNDLALIFALDTVADASSVAISDEKVRITSAGRVGINKNNPEGLLHIDGASNDPYIYLQRSGAGDAALDLGGIFWKNDTKLSALIKCRTIDRQNAELIFETMDANSRTERLRIKDDGKLMTQSAGFIFTASSAGSLTLAGGNTNLGGKIVLTGGNGTGDIKFYAQQATATPAQRMVITNDGKIGINETSPSRVMSINGNINLAVGSRIESYSSTGNLIIQGGSTYPGGHIRLYGGQGDNNITFNTSGASTSSTERMRIDGDGRILIGVTSQSISSSQRFEVSGMSYFSNNSTGTGTIYIRNQQDNTANVNSGAGAPFIVYTDGGGNRAGFFMNDSEQMGISSQGSLMFYQGGTAPANPTKPRGKLDGDGFAHVGFRTVWRRDHSISSSTATYTWDDVFHDINQAESSFMGNGAVYDIMMRSDNYRHFSLVYGTVIIGDIDNYGSSTNSWDWMITPTLNGVWTGGCGGQPISSVSNTSFNFSKGACSQSLTIAIMRIDWPYNKGLLGTTYHQDT